MVHTVVGEVNAVAGEVKAVDGEVKAVDGEVQAGERVRRAVARVVIARTMVDWKEIRRQKKACNAIGWSSVFLWLEVHQRRAQRTSSTHATRQKSHKNQAR